MARALTSFLLTLTTMLSALLCAASAVAWAHSHRSASRLWATLIGDAPGEPWTSWRIDASAGGLRVVRGVLVKEDANRSDVDEFARYHMPQWAFERYDWPPAYPQPSADAGGEMRMGFYYNPRYRVPGWQRPDEACAEAVAPLWFTTAAFGLMPGWRGLAWARRRRGARAVGRGSGRCARCGYDLRASPGVCPECGTAPARRAAGGAGAALATPDVDDLKPLPRPWWSSPAAAAGIVLPVVLLMAVLYTRSYRIGQLATWVRYEQQREADKTLFAGVETGDIAAVAWALDHGADVNGALEHDFSERADALGIAVSAGDPDIVRLLVERGADPRRTPGILHEVTGDRADEVARILIEGGADVNARTDDGETPLLVAPWVGGDAAARLVEVLVERGADVNARDDVLGQTPLARAVTQGDERVIEFLRRHGGEE